MAVAASTPMEALVKAHDLACRAMTGMVLSGFEVRGWDEAVAANREPTFPKVVGYAEIARLAGVSRQRAREFRKIPSFPNPVVETAQGPLFLESSIRAWVGTRNTHAGRRPTTI